MASYLTAIPRGTEAEVFMGRHTTNSVKVLNITRN